MSLELSGTTGVKGVAGSVSAPSIVGDDTNTGISFPSADTIKFSTGGVERMAITNSGVSGITAGITQADLFRLTTTINTPYNSVDVITANWERPDEADDMFDKIGSGMSQSSGVFTFPATGIYLVSFLGRWYANGNTSGENHLFIDGTVDNSNYNDLTSSAQNVPNSHTSTVYTQTLVDITDTSNRKIRLKYYAGAGNQRLIGATNKNETFAIFIRLGDT